MVFTDASVELFVLKVEEDSSFLDLAFFENLLDDFFAAKALVASFLENLSNDICYGSLAVAPLVKGVDAATDENKARILDELIMDSLDGDVFALEF